ncbi:MAG TPA: hypothetical protein DHN33_03735, partial [Eubacteriaceae bacterium]|nr:hypothetical protein [Eubacteriaceae bacterium]
MYHCQYGDIGEDVKQVQIILRQNDYLKNALEIDSIFGPKTKKAVCRFQRDSGLIADGVVGKNTYSALLFTRYPNFELSEFTCKCQGKYC